MSSVCVCVCACVRMYVCVYLLPTSREIFECGKSFHLDRLNLISDGVHLGYDDVIVVSILFPQLFPCWCQFFTVTTPRSIFDKHRSFLREILCFCQDWFFVQIWAEKVTYKTPQTRFWSDPEQQTQSSSQPGLWQVLCSSLLGSPLI